MSDEKRRSNTIRQALSQWQSVDVDAARVAVESSDLGEETRQKLLDSFPGTVTLPALDSDAISGFDPFSTGE
ncbi:MAG: hypothetical protein ACI9MB_004144 [Verrucomicrobiales bacterium]|jgi:hypothetical protein